MKYALALLLVTSLGVDCSTETTAPDPILAPDPPGLHTYADFPIGGAISIRKVARDSALRAIVLRDFTSVTSTNDFKAYRIADEPGVYDFSRADSTARFAEANDLRLFGHALVWHAFAPKWQQGLSAAARRDFFRAYVDTVARHFAGRVDGWDVVNEVVNTHGGGRRETLWSEAVGPGYIEEAFRIARAADPDAKLFINDFNTERDTAKLSTLLEIVEELRANGAPIDGIGFQMHIRVDTDTNLIAASLARAAATGLLIHVSEFDVIFNEHNDDQGGGVAKVTAMTPALLERQAKTFGAVARAYRQNVPAAQRYGITFWDFTDRDSWIDGFFGVEDWPTVYDDSLRAKPAWEGFRRGLR